MKSVNLHEESTRVKLDFNRDHPQSDHPQSDVEPVSSSLDQIKQIRPLSRIQNFLDGERLADMQWILNDTFLLALTEN